MIIQSCMGNYFLFVLFYILRRGKLGLHSKPCVFNNYKITLSHQFVYKCVLTLINL